MFLTFRHFYPIIYLGRNTSLQSGRFDLPFFLEGKMELFDSLSQIEESYLKVLNQMRKQDFSEKELGFVLNVVRFTSSPLLLAFIIACPKWYNRIEIKEMLSHHEIVPSYFQNYLRKVLSVIDLFRQAGTLQNQKEKERLLLKAKLIIDSLQENDKEFLKQVLTKNLQVKGCPEEDDVFFARVNDIYVDYFLKEESISIDEKTLEEKKLKAKTSTDSKELMVLALDPARDVFETAIKNRYLEEKQLLEVLDKTEKPEVITFIFNTPRWFFKEKVREKIKEHPNTPDAVKYSIKKSEQVLLLFEKLSKLKRNISERNKTIEQIVDELKTCSELELQYITVGVKRKWPQLLNIIKIVYNFMDQKGLFERETIEREIDFTNKIEESDIFKLIQRAAFSNDPKELEMLLTHNDLNVFRNTIANPGLKRENLLPYIHNFNSRKLVILANSPRWNNDINIVSRMLHNKNLPEKYGLKFVRQLTALKDLLDVLRDKKITSIEIKNVAYSTLLKKFNSMSLEERAKIIIDSKGEIFRELWSVIFEDEELLRTLLTRFKPDEEIVVRIVHSRLTPLSILNLIIDNNIHLDNIAVVIEFFSNPKVTSSMQEKLIEKLSPEIKVHLEKRGLI